MLSSSCGTKLRMELGCWSWGKLNRPQEVDSKKPQLATSTWTPTSEIGSWGHEVEALSYRSWRSSWGQVGGYWNTLMKRMQWKIPEKDSYSEVVVRSNIRLIFQHFLRAVFIFLAFLIFTVTRFGTYLVDSIHENTVPWVNFNIFRSHCLLFQNRWKHRSIAESPNISAVTLTVSYIAVLQLFELSQFHHILDEELDED